jgi:cytochrome b subunit of formate dehydrogenase
MFDRVLLPVLLVVGVCGVLAAQPPEGSQLPPDEISCIMCHGEADLWEGDTLRLHVPQEGLADDVHWKKGVNCHDCHGGDPSSFEVPVAHSTEVDPNGKVVAFRSPLAEVRKVCANCHKDQAIDLVKGVHDKAGEKDEQGRGTPLACRDCHGKNSHHILPAHDQASPVFLDHQVKTCGGCHEEHLKSYSDSVHGNGLYESGLAVTASCANCHGAHGIYRAADKRSTLFPANVAKTCGECHRFIEERIEKSVHGRKNGAGGISDHIAPGGKGKQLPSCTHCHQGHDILNPKSAAFRLQLPNRCGNCHQELSSRYAMSTHGQLTELGYAPAAKCSDCHGAHDILPPSEADSTLSPANRKKTCAKCHVYAVANFVDYDPHADYHTPEGNALLYWVHLGMKILLFSVFGFFGFHTILWCARSAAHTVQHGRPKRIVANQPAMVRFEPIHRLLHVIVIVSFLGLALTGLPLKYSDQDWAKTLARGLGGFDSTSVWHHVCAVATFTYFFAHLAWLARKIVETRAAGTGLFTIFFGPDSPVPNFRDVKDLIRMFLWFLGLGRKPQFERWTYWEKFDYWAVFWGMGIIGTSGLILWFPNLFTRFLPGESLNIAKVIHSEEALLATGFIFAIHFFNTHLRVEKFPMDMSMLSGLVRREEMEEERPEFIERMRREQKLEDLQATAPSYWRLLAIRMGGYTALFVGLALLAGMVLAALGK